MFSHERCFREAGKLALRFNLHVVSVTYPYVALLEVERGAHTGR
jgi:hypothetical protein